MHGWARWLNQAVAVADSRMFRDVCRRTKQLMLPSQSRILVQLIRKVSNMNVREIDQILKK